MSDALMQVVRDPEKWLTLVPAYGRDYQAAEDVLAERGRRPGRHDPEDPLLPPG